MNKIEKAIITELNEWDLSCSEEPILKIELAKALGRVVLNCFIPAVVERSEQLFCHHEGKYTLKSDGNCCKCHLPLKPQAK